MLVETDGYPKYPIRYQTRRHGMIPSEAWLGPDINVHQAIVLAPGAVTDIPVGVAEIQSDVPESRITGLVVNGRSSIAQLGGDLSLRAGERVATALMHPNVPEIITVPITNHSHAPLDIKEGPIGRLVNTHNAFVKGDAFEKLLANDEVTIEGDHDDWWVHTGLDGEIIGLGMVLKPERWIPDQSTPIVVPTSAGGNFRETLDAALQPIEPEDEVRIRIGETRATLGLSENILGYIDPRVDVSQTPSGVRVANRPHINARHLYGGYTWPIRTEILTTRSERESTTQDLPPKSVIFTFAKVASN